MATTTTTTTVKTATPATPKAASLGGLDLALVAASALVPMGLSALGMVPNPWTALAAAILGAVWTLCKTFITHKTLGSQQDVQDAVAKVVKAIEAKTGKDLFSPDVESAIEFGAAAAAASAGLTTPPSAS